MNKTNKIIRVYGRVQGVGFRYSALQIATSMGICGYVANESDGSVYIEAEGSADQLNQFIEWCRKGPARAVIQDVRHFPGQLMNYSSFTVR